jgi:hypothetical protein
MKWVVATVLFVFVQQGECKKERPLKVPPCIQSKIEAISQQPKYNPPATVYRYLYAGNYVYLFSSDCCDQYNYLYDKDCKLLCAPSGGIAGKGDGRCSNFSQMASDETLIWKDSR